MEWRAEQRSVDLFLFLLDVLPRHVDGATGHVDAVALLILAGVHMHGNDAVRGRRRR